MSNDTLKNKNIIDSKAVEHDFQSLDTLLHNIKNDFEKYLTHFSSSSTDKDFLERLISLEKDFKIVLKDFNELKKDFKEYKKSYEELSVQYQEVVGSINQLRLSIDDINQRYKTEKEQRLNVLWQILIPIVLSLLTFFFGIFFKSCSTIHDENMERNGNNLEYVDFNKK